MGNLSVVAHNLQAVYSNRQLGITDRSKAKSSEKLASGYRINRAADDAAGLAISEKMRKQIRGLDQGVENIQDGISMCQIMDGALNEIDDMIHRMNELSVKAANGTLSKSDREEIQLEMDQLAKEVDRTSTTTKFNEVTPLCPQTKNHLSGNYIEGGKADIVFVIDKTGSMGPYINNVVSELGLFADNLDKYDPYYGVVSYGDVGEDEPMADFPFTSSITELSDNLSSIASSVSGGGDEPESTLEGIMTTLDRFSFRSNSAKEIILVTDASYHDKFPDGSSEYSTAEVKSALKKNNVRLTVVTTDSYTSYYKKLSENVISMDGSFHDKLSSVVKKIAESAGNNSDSSESDNIYGNDAIIIQMSDSQEDTSIIKTYNLTARALGLPLSVITEEDATESIDKAGSILAIVSRIRSEIGAEQNGLEHASAVRNYTAENTTAAESRIRDTDMSEEMVRYSNLGILQQAGQSMLAQSNHSKEYLISLIQ